MLTRHRLAKALRQAGLGQLAVEAERGDFDMLQNGTRAHRQLYRRLSALAVTDRKAAAVAQRVLAGEFANTEAEIREGKS